MNRLKTLAAMTAMTALVGCSGGDDGDDRAQTVDPPSASASGVPSEAGEGSGGALTESQLQQALLEVADLPTGYTLAADQSNEDDDSEVNGETPECTERFKSLEGDEDSEAASAHRAFEGDGLGTILEQDLESYEDGEQISQRFEDVSAALSECSTFTSTDPDGTSVTFNVGALSFPKLGDATLALALSGDVDGTPIKANIVIVQVGSNVLLVTQGGLSTDAAALEQAARKAVEKLEAVA